MVLESIPNHRLSSQLVGNKELNITRFQIGNNRGGINGWIDENDIYGKCVRIEK